MDTVDLFENALLQEQRLGRGTVDAIVGDEPAVVVRLEGDGNTARLCDVLTTGAGLLDLSPGDPVLVWQSGRGDQRSVILGRIGARRVSAPVADAEPTDVPDELVIEAKRSLTLRVGSGSITIREDGKILIKGKDLVSHAQRTNRIKGGAVAIN